MTSSLVGLEESTEVTLVWRHRGFILWLTETQVFGDTFGMMKAWRLPLMPSRTLNFTLKRLVASCSNSYRRGDRTNVRVMSLCAGLKGEGEGVGQVSRG